MKFTPWALSGLVALLTCSFALGQNAPIAPAIPRPPRSDFSGMRSLLVSLHAQGALTDEELAKAEDKLYGVTLFASRELDRRPVPIFEPRPEFNNLPPFNGVVELVIEFTVAANGTVQNIHELNGTPAIIALPWIQAISAWRYSPGVKDGHPVATVMQHRSRYSMSYSSSSSQGSFGARSDPFPSSEREWAGRPFANAPLLDNSISR